MATNLPPPPAPPALRPRTGLALAALIVGILAVFSSPLLVGALFGLLGILLGGIHLSKRRGSDGLAWAGIGLSVLSIVLSAGLGFLYIELWKPSYEGLRSMQKGRAVTAAAVEESEPAFSEWVGKQIPDFTVTSLDGETLQSSALRGRRLVLDFWATWCPPCRLEIPHFMQLAQENSRDELLIIGISDEPEATLRDFVEKEGINYAIVSADDLPAPFDAIEAIPTTFFVDRNGRIQEVIVGYHDYDQLKEMALADDLPVVQPGEESDE